jgi:poly-gamma-glutamate capsule biosynthesis protein CapA/YwtB (metallophosphatase superfamily)
MRKLLFSILMLSAFASRGQDTTRLSLLFIGDIMQHQTQISAALDPATGKYDYKPCFQFIKPILSAPDLTIGNLELTLAGPPFTGYPQFSAPDELLVALKDAGFDVLVTANNHSMDRGRKGLERTIDLLDSANFLHTGTFKDTLDRLNNYPLLVESKGFRLSLLNYTYGTNGIPVRAPNIVNPIDTLTILKDLKGAAKQQPDAIIVFFHWGEEYKSMPNAWQKKLANFCFRNGAKLVIGAHPHVLQPIEWRKESDQLIAYSLGNFISAQWERYRNGGALLHIDLQKVRQPDGAGQVSIQNAQYSLASVYRARDPRRSYYLLPVDQFETDTTFVANKIDRAMGLQFRSDSRLLYKKENKNVEEKLPTAARPEP